MANNSTSTRVGGGDDEILAKFSFVDHTSHFNVALRKVFSSSSSSTLEEEASSLLSRFSTLREVRWRNKGSCDEKEEVAADHPLSVQVLLRTAMVEERMEERQVPLTNSEPRKHF